MKIGVVSDTHSRRIPEQLINDFKDVDLIIHAGDFVTVDQLNFFKQMKEFKAVYGNMDGTDIRHMVPKKEIFVAEGCTIGIFHGSGAPKDVLQSVIEEFASDKVDVVVHGHSHIPFNEKVNDVLYFCPGSPTDTVCAPYCAYGILTIKDGSAVAKVIRVE